MKKQIQVFDYADHILNSLKKGVLLTTKAGDAVNTMTISWGTLGIQWGKPIFTVFVRGCRFTSTYLEQNKTFTVNIPYGEFDKEILRICGTKSGRDMDKIRDLHLTLEDPAVISVPGIKELPLTLECKILYEQQQEPGFMLDDAVRSLYPADPQNIHSDFHTAYYGEIVAAYIIE